MNDRIEQPKDYCVQVTRKTPPPRYEQIEHYVGIFIFAVVLFVIVAGMLNYAKQADAAALNDGPVCVDYGTGHYVCER